MGINRDSVSVYKRIHESKTKKCNTEPGLCNMLSDNLADISLYLHDEASIYETANWILHRDRWVNNVNSSNPTRFRRGDIVTVELGAENFRYEPSYEHPAIVLVSRKFFSLIVPCSSQKYGKGFKEIIDADISDGFVKNTGIQTESFRWVSNNRLIKVNGKISTRVLNEIDKKILDLTPLYRKERIESAALVSELEDKIKSLEEEISNLEKS